MLSPYQLTFGAVCGICTGIFVKKGAKLVAFFLGGVYVLMQYLSSRSIVQINWSKLGNRYDSYFGSKSADGKSSVAPTVGGLYRWLVDFLTANFQREFTTSFTWRIGVQVQLTDRYYPYPCRASNLFGRVCLWS